MHGTKCFVLTEGVHRDNLVLQLRRYRRQKQLTFDCQVTQKPGNLCILLSMENAWHGRYLTSMEEQEMQNHQLVLCSTVICA